MKLDAASLSHKGQVRAQNEDACGFRQPTEQSELAEKGSIFVVADGMGGHRGGEIASDLAVQTVIKAYYASTESDPLQCLVKAFAEANRQILQKSVSDVALFGMGTTCTAVVIREDHAYFAHVGDSRAYVLRNGGLDQITEDHSLVGEMVRSGIITDEDAQRHPKKNVITRSLGTQDNIPTDTPASPFDVADGDIFLLCSDGLTSFVTDAEILPILTAHSPTEACQMLVDLANQRGGKDNITVQVIRITV